MQKVLGIGGVFFRAKDPAALAGWYQRTLGVDPVPAGPSDRVWMQEPGPTVLAPFPEDTDYFGDRAQGFMLNFRVRDLDAMIAQLREAGIEVETRAEWNSEIGRFARIHDPEGNPVELWQPPG
jgi:glyoxylase I family protein